MKVGDKAWLVDGKEANGDPHLVETEITKVGNKYFEVDYLRNRVNKETLRVDSQFHFRQQRVYLSKSEYENETESKKLWDDIKNFMNYKNFPDERMSLETIRELHALFKPYLPTQGK